MTLKSTAAVGLAGLAATWLASYAPAYRFGAPAPYVPSIAHTETAAAEIQREADRLHARLVEVGAYRDPARNPFRFGAHVAPPAAPRRAPVASPITVEESAADAAPVDPPIRLSLSGIAEDTVDGAVVRTAIISTPDDVILAKIGEEIAGKYRVTTIDPESVELTRIDSGVAIRLMMRRGRDD